MMPITVKSIILLISVITAGLSAGFFYAWNVSLIPGTKLLKDITYLETMQSINRAIINPAFILIFFGSLALLVVSTAQNYQSGIVFWLLLASTITYLLGTIGVTGLGNVPLNDQLDVLKLSGLDTEKITEFRNYYESQWNRLNLLRTVFAILSFVLSAIALFMHTKEM